MKNKKQKKGLIWTCSVFLALLVVLAVHIYWVYRPHVTVNTKVMARIDIKQPITSTDVGEISTWLAHENGIDHFLINRQSGIVIFTFLPIQNSGNQIVKDFKCKFAYSAERFIPSTDNLKHSCPMSSSFGYKIYQFINKII
ncbi:MAG TPA: hypothetical protein VNY73_07910 [Bacteroidia bacterium]|nr:hypothetical protein [Bacteroidia bacterium]